jgi:lipoprotein-anchoring transpeptidase ErfK/SrfK
VYGTAYTLEVSSLGEDAAPVAQTRSFSTVTVPQGQYWGVSFSSGGGKYYSVPLDGGTFGVGQPIIARFDDVPDRRVAESTITVKTDKGVEGSWSWVNEREMHWRPQEFWPAHTKVTVQANILGVRVVSPHGGRALYGRQNIKAAFTIGESKIAKVDNNTHLMTVWIDGVQVAVPHGRGCAYNGSENFGCTNNQQLAIRVSLGRSQIYTDISGRKNNYNTQSGIHVVTEKGNPVIMEGGGPCPSKTPGAPDCDPAWYREVIPNAVRLTDSGVYVHAASWSTGDQGYRNVSHGCVNIHPKDAEWFYSVFDKGDVVEIVNTGRQNERNNGTTDWNESWDSWLAGSALKAVHSD